MQRKMWCLICRSGTGADIVAGSQKHPGHDDPNPHVCFDYGCLSGGATPMLVAKDRRTGMVFALPVERRKQRTHMQSRSWHIGLAGIDTGDHPQ